MTKSTYMKRIILSLTLFIITIGAYAGNLSTTEGSLKDTLMTMLQRFSPYLFQDYMPLDSNYACFKGEHTGADDEQGVRTNADLSMVSAFLSRYAGRADLDTIAMKTLRFAIDTHKAVRHRPCLNGRYWGSVSKTDYRWESSLWAMSVAYSAYFQWDKLSPQIRTDLQALLRAECNYELERTIPTGYVGDTKAEENGWEVDVLAAALGLFPNDTLAPQWFERLRAFAINSYSHPSDAHNTTIIDPWYDSTTIAQLYQGPNLYPDWTLQNHGFFHTSYQNVVIQELGEAALALRLFQGTQQKWHTNALLHNCDSVAQHVLNWLTLPDGEQAMPNGNDWSLFLYDQITSYSTLACLLADADALFFEKKACTQIMQRQQTTNDGTWLLHADVGARRMGVQAHRVMMSWLMHHTWPTDTLHPTTWNNFLQRYNGSKIFPCQQLVRTLTPKYFACFAWSKGKQSYTGYIQPLQGNGPNLVVPYRWGNTGNLLGGYKLKGKHTNAQPLSAPEIKLRGKYFEIQGQLLENDSTLKRSFTLRSTSQGLRYKDNIEILRPIEVVADCTGLLAISTDIFTQTHRKVERQPGCTIIDGRLVVRSHSKDTAQWGHSTTDNSITTTKLYPYSKPMVRSHLLDYECR